MFAFPSFLYAITPDQANTSVLIDQVYAALDSGIRLIQYRDKTSDMANKLARGRLISALCSQAGAQLIVNDDVVLAMKIEAAGVHLGGSDGDIQEARRLLPSNSIIGASCYDNIDLAHAALASGASYVAFGACFPSPTKLNARHITTEQLKSFSSELQNHIAICAIGGINCNNIMQIKDTVNAVALISTIFGSNSEPAPPQKVRSNIYEILAASSRL